MRLGTRGSPLALAQAGWIARQLLEQCGQPTVLVTATTPGDESTAPIERLGTTGVFTTTLREALMHGAVDLVVHSGKDLPTSPVPGLRVAAFPAREDPRDALVWPGGTSLEALPPGARIGTGSPRRAALLRAIGPHLEIVPMRGNVDTRLRKLADGKVDALVLSMAGLRGSGCSTRPSRHSTRRCSCRPQRRASSRSSAAPTTPVTAAQLRALDHAPTRVSGDHRTRLPGRAPRRLQRAGRALAEVAGQTGADRRCACPASSPPRTAPRWSAPR